MNDGIRTYAGMFDYEYLYEPEKRQRYIECMQTGDVFKVYWRKHEHKFISTFDARHYDRWEDAVAAYETAVNDAWQTAYRNLNRNDHGAIIS